MLLLPRRINTKSIMNFFDGVLGRARTKSATLVLTDLSDLDAPFLEEEAWSTIKSLPADRAPGPDGSLVAFTNLAGQLSRQISWQLWFVCSKMVQGDWSYLTLLIPKKLEALEAKDYRPISLVHSFAKLVTKMMANRLAPYLDKLVATNQSAFTRGRCIHDNFMLVQQTIKVLHRRKISSLFLKLDISSQKLLIQLIGLFYWKFCHT